MKKAAYILAGTILLGSSLMGCDQYRSTPPILVGIKCDRPNHCNSASDLFRKRLHGQYPIGSMQDALEHDLISQGFKRRYKGITHCTKPGQIEKVGTTGVACIPQDQDWNPQHGLSYWNCEGGFTCTQYATVIWSSDAEGHITYLNAGYEVTAGIAGL